MIDVEFQQLYKYSHEMGFWLDEHMANPPLPEPQRWSIGYSPDGRVGFKFADEKDATHFMLRWS